ncbi:MAG: glycolate oxidase subunit GlcF [Gammaproteobacteria bacterium]
MQTFIPEPIKSSPEGIEADRILRKCVHCGFCSATCPTYQIKGDELDGPRGRIYLIKNLLEGNEVTEETQLHLDRCLTCRACETTCPSGVEYGHLLDIGRQLSEKETPRSFKDKLIRSLLGKILPHQKYFSYLVKLGQFFHPVLPEKIAATIPAKQQQMNWPTIEHQRKMLILDGCVQPVLSPSINMATARVLDVLGISLINEKEAGCCGAVNQHLSQVDDATIYIKNNIDSWWPHIEAGAEAILITASGCGAMVKDYGYLLRDDQHYSEKAERVSSLCKDLIEVIEGEDLSQLNLRKSDQKIVFQSPCSLQHGQKLPGRVETFLQKIGCELSPVRDSHLCCGSAGTYSILQSEMAEQLRENKINNLTSEQPDVILTANIGCQQFLQQKSNVPVLHWIELIEQIRIS